MTGLGLFQQPARGEMPSLGWLEAASIDFIPVDSKTKTCVEIVQARVMKLAELLKAVPTLRELLERRHLLLSSQKPLEIREFLVLHNL
jgi:hypothetical protein